MNEQTQSNLTHSVKAYFADGASHRWLIFFGAIQLVLGFAALAMPVAATVAFEIVIGSVLAVFGGFQFVHSFYLRKTGAKVSSILISVMYLAAGIIMLQYIQSGMLALTIATGVAFVLASGLRLGAAFQLKKGGRLWLIVGAIASFVIGLLILTGLPQTAYWSLGILLAVDLIISGSVMVTWSTYLEKPLKSKNSDSFEYSSQTG